MRTSPTTAKLSAAIAAAQKNMRNPGFDRENAFFSTSSYRARYATLAATRDAVIPALAAEGVAVTQERSVSLVDTEIAGIDGATRTDRRIMTTVTTRLACGDEWIETDTTVYAPAESRGQDGRTRDMVTPQGIASAGTYACRYALQAACVVTGDDDDDANDASRGSDATRRAPTLDHLRQLLAGMPRPEDGTSRDEQEHAWVSWCVGSRIADISALDPGQLATAHAAAVDGRMPPNMPALVARWRASTPAQVNVENVISGPSPKVAEKSPEVVAPSPPARTAQPAALKKLHTMLGKLGVGADVPAGPERESGVRAKRLDWVALVIGRKVASSSELTPEELKACIDVAEADLLEQEEQATEKAQVQS